MIDENQLLDSNLIEENNVNLPKPINFIFKKIHSIQ